MVALVPTLLASAALAWPTTWVGVRAGAATAPVQGAPLGVGAGLAADLSLHPQLSVELVADGSAHGDRASIFSAGGGLQYRFDVTTVVPYVTGTLRWIRVSARGGYSDDAVGALGVGLLLPIGERWFAGVDATYGYGLFSGAFPLFSTWSLRAGWRSGDF